MSFKQIDLCNIICKLSHRCEYIKNNYYLSLGIEIFNFDENIKISKSYTFTSNNDVAESGNDFTMQCDELFDNVNITEDYQNMWQSEYAEGMSIHIVIILQDDFLITGICP